MKEALRFIKFFFISISAGLIEIGTFTLLNEVLKLKYWPCYLIALVLSVLWNFTLNRKYTFKSGYDIKKSMLLVFLYYLVFTPTTTVLGNYLVEQVHINEYLVTGLNMVLNFITEFLYQRFVVYKDKVDTV